MNRLRPGGFEFRHHPSQQVLPVAVTVVLVIQQNIPNVIAERARRNVRGKVKRLDFPQSIGAKQGELYVLGSALQSDAVRFKRTRKLSKKFVGHVHGGGAVIFADRKHVKRSDDFYGLFREFGISRKEVRKFLRGRMFAAESNALEVQAAEIPNGLRWTGRLWRRSESRGTTRLQKQQGRQEKDATGFEARSHLHGTRTRKKTGVSFHHSGLPSVTPGSGLV